MVVLPLLTSDLLPILWDCARGQLDPESVIWDKEHHCIGVVMVTKSYPESRDHGTRIEGIPEQQGPDVFVFQGGTTYVPGDPDHFETKDAGRILTVVGKGPTRERTRSNTYKMIPQIRCKKSAWRKDIAPI